MDLPSCVLPDLRPLNLDEIDIMCSCMDDCEEKDRVGYLPMEEQVFVQGKKPCQLRSQYHDEVAKYHNSSKPCTVYSREKRYQAR